MMLVDCILFFLVHDAGELLSTWKFVDLVYRFVVLVAVPFVVVV